MANEQKAGPRPVPATVEKSPVEKKYDTVRTLMQRMEGQLKVALPRHLTADRFIRVFLTTARRTPQLLDADQASLLGALMTCAQLGLEPDGALGQAYLVPFRNGALSRERKRDVYDVVLIPGYRGLADLARRSGLVDDVEMRVVRKGDHFVYRYGTTPGIEHVPADEDGELTHAYAIVWLKTGKPHFEVLTRAAIERTRTRSRSGDSGPWKTDYEAMAMKTAVRRACKLAPASVELQRAIALDERAEVGVDQELYRELPEGSAGVLTDRSAARDGLDSLVPGQEQREAAELSQAAAATEEPEGGDEPKDEPAPDVATIYARAKAKGYSGDDVRGWAEASGIRLTDAEGRRRALEIVESKEAKGKE